VARQYWQEKRSRRKRLNRVKAGAKVAFVGSEKPQAGAKS
jgi:hypothetical protein